MPAARRSAVIATAAPLTLMLLPKLTLSSDPVPLASALMARVPPLKVMALLFNAPVAPLPPVAPELLACRMPALR